MPKIIKNLDETILNEAKIQLFKKGYSAMTMRSVADACYIAVGTLYNYYDSKNELVTRIMIRDWESKVVLIREKCEKANNIYEGFRIMFDDLRDFTDTYRFVWSHFGRDFSIRRDMPEQYNMFVSELSDILSEILVRCHDEHEQFLSLFLAEIMLSAATKWEFTYEQMEFILKRLMRDN